MALPVISRQFELVTPGQHYDHLHADAIGVAVVWEKSAAGSGKWLKLKPGDHAIPSVLAGQAGCMDRFISVNEFHGWRRVSLLKSLRALYVDIDGNVNLEEVLDAIASAQLPAPTLVMWSGRGLHLYWVHSPVPANALPIWQRCQDLLIKALKHLGGDSAAKDCTRILRLAGSVNSKNMEPVRGLVFDAVPWDFHSLCNEVLGYRPPFEPNVVDLATAKAHRGTRLHANSVYDRWHLVYTDLLKIAEYHGPGGIPQGHRNNWIFLSAVALAWFANPHTLRDELTNQARRWTKGFAIGDIDSAIQSALQRADETASGRTRAWRGQEEDPRYKFSRAKLWELMSPIVPRTLEHSLRAIVGDEVRAEHKKASDKAHEVTRNRATEGRYESHQRGRKVDAASLSQRKPWETLGMSRATYYRRKALE